MKEGFLFLNWRAETQDQVKRRSLGLGLLLDGRAWVLDEPDLGVPSYKDPHLPFLTH